MAKGVILLILFVFSFTSWGNGAPITLAQQQAARDKIGQLNVQKQQLQNQINNNNSQAVQNNLQIAQLAAKIVQLQYQHGTSTGIPTDVNAGIAMAEATYDIKRLQKENANLQQQNQNLTSQIEAIDQKINEQNSILSQPTKSDLQQDLNNANQSVKNDEDYINWLTRKNQPQQDIDDSIRILKNNKIRRDQIQDQINNGEYRETPPPPSPRPPVQQSYNPVAPPPGWSPVGESVADAYHPSIDSQTASSQATQQEIQSNYGWEEAQHHGEGNPYGNSNFSSSTLGAPSNGVPPGTDWNQWLQNNSLPPTPTGGTSSGSENHHHHSDGSDSGGSASDMT
ncbi:MAG: hypothetical protein HYS07_09705 [Chlamydiae bacterium]|nr:hypothetical protein [Chlamydiota bacterium]MBI3277951.1 hypothetical protein [Chlamydiota bacterium]